MQATSLSVTGRAQGSQPASQATDFVRLGEMQTQLGARMLIGGPVLSNQISDLSPTVLALLAAAGIGVPTPVALRPNGGLLSGVGGLYVNSGIVSFVGHKHSYTDLVDFTAGLLVDLPGVLMPSGTVTWAFTSSGITPLVRYDTTQALTQTGAGLAVALGTGHTQAAYGDHTHAQLHAPVTVEPSSSLAITLNGQDLDLEARLAPLSGLLITPSGLAVDFGTGHNQVARGDSTQATPNALAVFSTASLLLYYDPVAAAMSGIVRLDGNPPAGGGLLGQDSNGLYVELGTAANTAAPGNHTHSAATETTDGFMSAADKLRLDTIAAGELSLCFTNEAALLTGQYLLGTYQWLTRPVTPRAVFATYWPGAGSGISVLGLEIEGVLTGYQLALPPGTPNQDTPVSGSGIVGLTVQPGQAVRWKVVSGPAPESAACHVTVNLLAT